MKQYGLLILTLTSSLSLFGCGDGEASDIEEYVPTKQELELLQEASGASAYSNEDLKAFSDTQDEETSDQKISIYNRLKQNEGVMLTLAASEHALYGAALSQAVELGINTFTPNASSHLLSHGLAIAGSFFIARTIYHTVCLNKKIRNTLTLAWMTGHAANTIRILSAIQ